MRHLRPEEALFRPAFMLSGILKCMVCGEAFITAAWLRKLKAEAIAAGRSTKWIGAPEAEQERRRTHGRYHVSRGEAITDAAGWFLLPATPAKTARDYGFSMETE